MDWNLAIITTLMSGMYCYQAYTIIMQRRKIKELKARIEELETTLRWELIAELEGERPRAF